MLKRLMTNKKAQQTAEYALLISLVVAAVVAMQMYAQRTIQARIRDASAYLSAKTNALGTTNQYEPYYLETDYKVFRDEATADIQGQRASGGGLFAMDQSVNRTRAAGGFQQSKYDTTLGLKNGI